MSKVKLLWLSGITCNGNAHSFLQYPHLKQFFCDFEFLYHPVIDSQYSLEEITACTLECDILLLEGALSESFKRADSKLTDLLWHYAKKAKAVVCLGTCASFGGIFAQSDAKVQGLHFNKDQELVSFEAFKEKSFNLSGCPVHAKTIADTLYAIKENYQIKKDSLLRPKAFYAYTVHNGCTRNEYFEYKIDTHDFGKLEGCMFYDHGCQAPFTHAPCNKTLWNEVNSKTRVGMPCVGCTEPSFPRLNLFQTKKNMGIQQDLPVGVAKRTYLTLAGVSKAFTIERLQKGLMDD